MEPVMTVLGVVSVISLLSTSWGWLKRAFGLGASNQVAVLLTTTEFLPAMTTTALPTSGKPLKNAVTVINGDDVELAKLVQSTTTAASASSSSSPLGLIILLLIVVGVVGFFIYRKRAKRNQATARTVGGTPPSPTVSQSEQNRSSLWSNKADQNKLRNFNIV